MDGDGEASQECLSNHLEEVPGKEDGRWKAFQFESCLHVADTLSFDFYACRWKGSEEEMGASLLVASSFRMSSSGRPSFPRFPSSCQE